MSLRNVQLTPQLVQAVRDAVDVVDIASDYTKLKKAGRRHKGLCPLHKEKTPSFSVEPTQGLFYCFGCGQGGDAIRLHELLTGDDFPAAIESLARRYGIPLPTSGAGRGKREGPDLEPVLDAAAVFFQERLRESQPTLAYLERRRIPGELVERYGLGYAPDDWRTLLEALQSRFPTKDLEAAGLLSRSEKQPDRPYDRFRNRLIFPIRNTSGRLVGFGGRTLGDDRAKYINTADTERFVKSHLLYGLDVAKRSIRDGGRAFLVEGYLDVIGAAAAGIDCAVASMGTSLTEDQARLLDRFADEVVIGYDGDEAGVEASRRALQVLLGEGLTVRRAALPEGHDPDSFRIDEGEERLRALVDEAEDAVAAEIDRLTPGEVRLEPRRQAEAGRAVAELLGPIPDSILRYSYTRMAAERLGVPVDLLWRRLGRRDEARPSGPAPPQGGGVVRSVEERVLQLLLAGGESLPDAGALPPEEVFFDPDLRNIYRSFRALYRGEGEDRPDAQSVLAGVGAQGRAVDQLARLLLEEPAAAAKGELEESLARLRRRWQKRRIQELSTEIMRAQRLGDAGLRDRLVLEKDALSRELHGRRPAGPGGVAD